MYHDIYDNLWSNQCKSDSHICSKQSDFAHTGTDECLVPGSSTFLAPPRGSTLVHRDSCLWQENWNYLCDRGTRIIDPRFDRQNMPLLGVAWIWPGPTDWGELDHNFVPFDKIVVQWCAQVEQLEPHRPEHWGEQLINPVTSQVKVGMKIHDKSYLTGLLMENGIIWKMPWKCHGIAGC